MNAANSDLQVDIKRSNLMILKILTFGPTFFFLCVQTSKSLQSRHIQWENDWLDKSKCKYLQKDIIDKLVSADNILKHMEPLQPPLLTLPGLDET